MVILDDLEICKWICVCCGLCQRNIGCLEIDTVSKRAPYVLCQLQRIIIEHLIILLFQKLSHPLS